MADNSIGQPPTKSLAQQISDAYASPAAFDKKAKYIEGGFYLSDLERSKLTENVSKAISEFKIENSSPAQKEALRAELAEARASIRKLLPESTLKANGYRCRSEREIHAHRTDARFLSRIDRSLKTALGLDE